MLQKKDVSAVGNLSRHWSHKSSRIKRLRASRQRRREIGETKARDFPETVGRKVQVRKMLYREKAEVWEAMSVDTIRDRSENNPQAARSVRLQDPWFWWYYSVMTFIHFIMS